MAYTSLGSKSGAFHCDGQTWFCSTGLPSDICVEIGEMSFHLHKFPLMSRSGLIEKLIEEFPSEDGSSSVLQLHDMPGGAKAFEFVTKFCYGVKTDITPLNVVSLRCAADYLQMNEDHGEGNLIMKAEEFFNEVFSNWTYSIKALETCEEVLPYAEELHIVSRCIDSLAIKACSDTNLFNWPCNDVQSPVDTASWNGIYNNNNAPKSRLPAGDDWWHEDVSLLSLPLFKRFILAVESRSMNPESIASSLMYYSKRYLPLMNWQSSIRDPNNANTDTSISNPSDSDHTTLVEEIVELLPNKKGVTSTKFLLRMLRTAMILHASTLCRENLERRVGAQLDQASLEDLLIPNVGYSVETLYDMDCIQRILDHFVLVDQAAAVSFSPSIVEESKLSDTLTPMTLVANLVDGYLAEMAPDVNLKLPKFQALAAVIPDYARPLNDGIYHAIDVYLKAHPWLTDSERELLCRLMNCQKLSLDASSHAAQNERLPLRVIVQVLFFEQLRLRTSISGWFFVSENLENTQNNSANFGVQKNDGPQDGAATTGTDDVRERIAELEKECLGMKQEIQKLTKMKKSWSILPKKFFFRQKPHPPNSNQSKPCDMKEPIASGKAEHKS